MTVVRLSVKLWLKTETSALTANTKFLPGVGNNIEFRRVSFHLNQYQLFGLSLNGNRTDLLNFKKRTLALENADEQKDKVRAQLRQNLQQALLSKELKRLRDSASIEVINPVFRTPGA